MACGFVYAGELTKEGLQNLLKQLGSNFTYFVWTLKTFTAGENILSDFGDNGIAFNEACEVKWRRTKGENFRVLLLSDSPKNNLLLDQIEGKWEVEEQTTYLFSLEDKRIAPPFNQYPVVNKAKAKLRCKVFYRDGVAMFVSPREVISDENGTT